MKKILGLASVVVSVLLTACGTLSNQSLDYKQAKQIEPLKASGMRESVALYPSPIIDDEALKNAPVFENKRGNRYQLPRPDVNNAGLAMRTQLVELKPQFIFDSKKNPLLQIAGNTEKIWQFTTATVNSLSYKVESQSDRAIKLTVDGQSYVLYLSQVGNTHILAVFDNNGQFATQDVANEILTQIYSNWPL